MERYRHGMGFSQEDRQTAHKRAGTSCEFPAGCENKNTGKVNHITGVFEAFLDHKDPRAIRDINLNSALLCDTHEATHDAQEAFQVQSLLGERRKSYYATQRRRHR
jgi:hypothetical protein